MQCRILPCSYPMVLLYTKIVHLFQFYIILLSLSRGDLTHLDTVAILISGGAMARKIFSLDDELLREIKTTAETDGISDSELIRRGMVDYLNKRGRNVTIRKSSKWGGKRESKQPK